MVGPFEMLIVVPKLSDSGDGGYWMESAGEVVGLSLLELLIPEGERTGELVLHK